MRYANAAGTVGRAPRATQIPGYYMVEVREGDYRSHKTKQPQPHLAVGLCTWGALRSPSGLRLPTRLPAQQAEDLLRALVRLGDHGIGRLLQHLRTRHRSRFLGKVSILNPAARSSQVLR